MPNLSGLTLFKNWRLLLSTQPASFMTNTILVCTPDEILKMIQSGECKPETNVLPLNKAFEVLCEHYGVDPHWAPNDVY